MANEFKIKKGLIVTGASGGTVVDIQGSQGQLFSVTDDLSGSIFAVSDISGVPILDVNSDGTSYFDGNVGIGTSNPSEKLNVSGNILATGTIAGSNLSGTNTGDQVLPTDFVSAANGGTFSGKIRVDVPGVALGSQPLIVAEFDGTDTDGLALISVDHTTRNTAGALGAGIRFKTGDGSSGSSNKFGYIFMQGGNNSDVKYIAPRTHTFYVDGHDDDLIGVNYNDYGTQALILNEDGTATFSGNILSLIHI